MMSIGPEADSGDIPFLRKLLVGSKNPKPQSPEPQTPNPKPNPKPETLNVEAQGHRPQRDKTCNLNCLDYM
jgi:hypothetical protein